MSENLKNWLIDKLGGYTPREWHTMCIQEDTKHEAALEKKDETIRELAKLPDFTPDDCIRGAWCSECVFVRRKHVRIGQYPDSSYIDTYYCGKAEVCKHLLIKEVTHE